MPIKHRSITWRLMPCVAAFAGARVPAVAAAVCVGVIIGGCGSDSPPSGSGGAPSATPAAAQTPTDRGAPAALVGEWETRNVCEEQVRALRRHGLGRFAREWVAGAEYPGARTGEVAPDSYPCLGATPMRHSHSFGADGSFASFNQDGEQVDDGSYTEVDERTLALSEPPVRVRFLIDGDDATFRVSVPDCKTKRCRQSAAYVISVFFPHEYKRVK